MKIRGYFVTFLSIISIGTPAAEADKYTMNWSSATSSMLASAKTLAGNGSVRNRRRIMTNVHKAYHQWNSSTASLLSTSDHRRPCPCPCPCDGPMSTWQLQQRQRFSLKSEAMMDDVIMTIRGGEQGQEQKQKQQSRDRNEELFYIQPDSKKVYIAIGANMGDRFGNLMKAFIMLNQTTWEDVGMMPPQQETSDANGNDEPPPLIRVHRTSFLRETAPMYVTDQDKFLNGAIEITTILSPHLLLQRLKNVELKIGRDLKNGLRYGPRPIDLDIVYYDIEHGDRPNDNGNGNGKKGGGLVLHTDDLQVPHPRMAERDFVMSPLCDLDKDVIHPRMNLSSEQLLSQLEQGGDGDTTGSLEGTEGSNDSDGNGDSSPTATRVLPLPRGRMLSFHHVHIMGILNVTPDSFSDGGEYDASVDVAVEQALKMVKDGASIIDIGGESTRPGAKEVAIEIELNRTIPVIRKLREVSDIPISIDTRHSEVAKAAIDAGADIVNDVSGGTFDPLMLSTVADLHVPIILMHMRGTPETMQSMTHYDNVVSEVAHALMVQSKRAEELGIPKCLQVLDPGIGFAKEFEHNLSLLKHCNTLRDMVGDVPLLLGPSRKRFIGTIAAKEGDDDVPADQRDFGTLAACLAGIVGSDATGTVAPTILRVHNVKGIHQGVRVMEAILHAK